jgi:hypothetical protein
VLGVFKTNDGVVHRGFRQIQGLWPPPRFAGLI